MLSCQGETMKLIQGGESIAERYALVRSRSGLTKKAFAESLGIHPVVSGDIELGKRDPSRDVLVRLARVYGVDLTWLLTGANPDQSHSGIPTRDDDEGPVALVDYVRQEAAAGRGVEIEDNAETVRLPVLRSFIAPRKPERVRAVEVRGDSMTGIGLDDRDIVLFAPDERTGDGVHVVSFAGQLLVKRVHFDPIARSVNVISENPAYPARVLSGVDLDSFRVEGRVVGWMHRY
jgi:phage repressor protein C with HTH and peptisase S24 domain